MLLRFLNSHLVLTISLFAASSSIYAQDTQVNGFIGLGQSFVSANNFLGDDAKQHEIVELGANIRHEFTQNVSFSAQLAYRRFGNTTNDKGIRLDYASLDYATSALAFGEQTFSVGRIKSVNGIYNASRDVPMSRPSIFLAQSVYTDVFRNLTLSIDGIKVNSSHEFHTGILSMEFGYGHLNIDDNLVLVTLGNDGKGSWSSDKALIGDLRYSSNTLTAGVSYNSGRASYSTELGSLVQISPFLPPIPVTDGKIALESYTAFAQYFVGKVELSAEYVYRQTEFDGFVPFVQFPKNLSHGYYGQIKYYVTPAMSLLVRLDKFDKSLNNEIAQDLPLFASLPALPNWAGKASTQTLGINWQMSQHWSLGAEVHLVSGSGWLPPFGFSSAASLEQKHWKLGAVQAIYRF